MNKGFASLFGVLAACMAASAQNLNPEIVVTNEYETRMPLVPKVDLAMSCPDSLKEFRYGFDYSVFDNPYSGSYEFSPYVVKLEPGKTPARGSSFFLRAGAGYSLHPVLDFAWSPLVTSKASVSLLQHFGGYWGSYRSVGNDLRTVKGNAYEGYDLAESLTLTGRMGIGKAFCEAFASYEGFFNSSPYGRSAWHNASAQIGVSSTGGGRRILSYGLSLAFDAGSDRHSSGILSENLFRIKGSLEPQISKIPFRIFADLSLELAACQGAIDCSGSAFSFAPKGVFRFGPLNLLAGVNISAGAGSDPGNGPFSRTGQILYPDVEASVSLIGGAMDIYALIKGGVRQINYHSLKSSDHRFSGSWAPFGALLDNEIERMNAGLGVRGIISDRFQYDLNAGYGIYAGTPFTGIGRRPDTGDLFPVVSYLDNNLLHADLKSRYAYGPVEVEGNLAFRKCDTRQGNVPAVLPAALSGGLTASDSLRGRLGLCIGADVSGSRKAVVADLAPGGWTASDNTLTVPGYVDLNISAEYLLNRNWALWLRAGNLLDADLQILPLSVENGINFTAGICLKL